MTRSSIPWPLVLLGTSSVAFAADSVKLHYARHAGDDLVECADLVVGGMSDSEIANLKDSFSGDGVTIIETPCSTFPNKALGICTFKLEKDGKSFGGSSHYYSSDAFGAKGYESECKDDLKGKWTTTQEGFAVRAKVLKEEARIKKLNSLPQAESSQVAEDYDANVVAADSKYKGKTFALLGIVQKVDKDHRGRIYIQTQGGNQFIGVHLLVSNTKYAATLNPGDEVWLECVGQGQGHLQAATFSCKSPG